MNRPLLSLSLLTLLLAGLHRPGTRPGVQAPHVRAAAAHRRLLLRRGQRRRPQPRRQAGRRLRPVLVRGAGLQDEARDLPAEAAEPREATPTTSSPGSTTSTATAGTTSSSSAFPARPATSTRTPARTASTSHWTKHQVFDGGQQRVAAVHRTSSATTSRNWSARRDGFFGFATFDRGKPVRAVDVPQRSRRRPPRSRSATAWASATSTATAGWTSSSRTGWFEQPKRRRPTPHAGRSTRRVRDGLRRRGDVRLRRGRRRRQRRHHQPRRPRLRPGLVRAGRRATTESTFQQHLDHGRQAGRQPATASSSASRTRSPWPTWTATA